MYYNIFLPLIVLLYSVNSVVHRYLRQLPCTNYLHSEWPVVYPAGYVNSFIQFNLCSKQWLPTDYGGVSYFYYTDIAPVLLLPAIHHWIHGSIRRKGNKKTHKPENLMSQFYGKWKICYYWIQVLPILKKRVYCFSQVLKCFMPYQRGCCIFNFKYT